LATARQLGETSLCFMVHPTLATATLDAHVAAMREVMTEASR
jgi:hypothetical protein